MRPLSNSTLNSTETRSSLAVMDDLTTPYEDDSAAEFIECSVCEVSLRGLSLYKIHLTTPGHLKKEDAAVAAGNMVRKQIVPKFQDIVQYLDYLNLDEPIIGLDFLDEVPSGTADHFSMGPRYTCKLCTITAHQPEMVHHLIGRKHRQKYIETKRQDLVSWDRHSPMTQSGKIIRARAEIITRQDGSGRPVPLKKTKNVENIMTNVPLWQRQNKDQQNASGPYQRKEEFQDSHRGSFMPDLLGKVPFVQAEARPPNATGGTWNRQPARADDWEGTPQQGKTSDLDFYPDNTFTQTRRDEPRKEVQRGWNQSGEAYSTHREQGAKKEFYAEDGRRKLQTPGSDYQSPRLDYQREDNQPSRKNYQFGSGYDRPDDRPQRPDYQSMRPEYRPARLDYQPQRPDDRRQLLDDKSMRPDHQPTRPDYQPQRPDDRRQRPDDQPLRLDYQSTRSAQQPRHPDDRPQRLDYQPPHSDYQSTRPDYQPQRPAFQPPRPDYQRPDDQRLRPDDKPPRSDYQSSNSDYQPQRSSYQFPRSDHQSQRLGFQGDAQQWSSDKDAVVRLGSSVPEPSTKKIPSNQPAQHFQDYNHGIGQADSLLGRPANFQTPPEASRSMEAIPEPFRRFMDAPAGNEVSGGRKRKSRFSDATVEEVVMANRMFNTGPPDAKLRAPLESGGGTFQQNSRPTMQHSNRFSHSQQNSPPLSQMGRTFREESDLRRVQDDYGRESHGRRAEDDYSCGGDLRGAEDDYGREANRERGGWNNSRDSRREPGDFNRNRYESFGRYPDERPERLQGGSRQEFQQRDPQPASQGFFASRSPSLDLERPGGMQRNPQFSRSLAKLESTLLEFMSRNKSLIN